MLQHLDLLESDIPLDVVGGTSVGAIVGACYATSETYAELVEKFGLIMQKTSRVFSPKNFTWPSISIINAKSGTEILQQLFENKKIEDLWMPYFCASCNLSVRKEAIHYSGYLWEKIRSSASLPGLVPPVVIDGQLHVDGGLLNNLPVDAMRTFLGLHSKIIAVSLSSEGEDTNVYHFPPILTFKHTFLAKLKLAYRNYKFPSFFDTFLKSLLVGSSNKEIMNCIEADMLVAPNLINFNMLSIKEAQKKELIEIGYSLMCEQINNMKWDRSL